MEFFKIVNIAEAAFFADVSKRFLWAYLVIGASCFAAFYVFRTVALYTIAKREGFKNRWMAFIPFFNTYYVGVLSDKNNVFRAKAKSFSLAAALVELSCCALFVLYYVSTFIIFKGGYAVPDDTADVANSIITGYSKVYLKSPLMPVSLDWAWWVFANMQDYVLYWLQLAYALLNVFVLVAFFRTYAPSKYVLFSILSVLFPISSIFMFVVRNNRGVNYVAYMRERQQRQYRMYQEYMRNNPDYQGGNSYGGYQNDPYAQPRPSTPPDDPFGGLGSNQSGSSGDPFDDFKN